MLLWLTFPRLGLYMYINIAEFFVYKYFSIMYTHAWTTFNKHCEYEIREYNATELILSVDFQVFILKMQKTGTLLEEQYTTENTYDWCSLLGPIILGPSFIYVLVWLDLTWQRSWYGYTIRVLLFKPFSKPSINRIMFSLRTKGTSLSCLCFLFYNPNLGWSMV